MPSMWDKVLRGFRSRGLGRRDVWGWAFYDWANSAFATTVMAGFFPLFFKKYWATGLEPVVSTAHLGFSNSIASVVLAFLSPFLGALADSGSHRKFYLGLFTLIGAVVTGLLFWVPQGLWWGALLCYLVAYLGYSLSLVFYDSLIQNVSEESNVDIVSSVGYGLGYLGGGLLFAVNVWMFLKPEILGLSDGAAAIRLSFLMVSVWWVLFALPSLILVKEKKSSSVPVKTGLVKTAVLELFKTIKIIKADKNVVLFLVAYWLYMDGVSTIFKMAVDFGLSIGLKDQDLIGALLITQFVGFPSAIAFGFIAQKWSPKTGILLGLAVYMGVVVLGATMNSGTEFYILATLVGLVQGGVQALSRSFFARLVPAEKSAEYFGFYNLMGRFVSFIGPSLIAVTGLLTQDSRTSILPVGMLFLVGAVLLIKVKAVGPSTVKSV